MSEVRSGSAVPEDKRQVGIRIELSDWLLDFDLSKSSVGRSLLFSKKKIVMAYESVLPSSYGKKMQF